MFYVQKLKQAVKMALSFRDSGYPGRFWYLYSQL